MSNRAIALCLLLTGAVVLAGCQSLWSRDDEEGSSADAIAIRNATEAYLAYQHGDCDGVRRSASREEVERWQATELRHSLLLVHGFCQELSGQTQEAIDTYRALIQDAPLSYASDDARERLRILRLTRNDPEYGRWVGEARQRARSGSSERVPVERVPADFPPLARQAGIEGYAVVEFGVTPRGDTDAPVVVDSQPPLLFDGAALRAVREWRYTRDPSSTAAKRQAIRIVFKAASQEDPSLLEEDEGAGEADTATRSTIQ